MDLTPEYMNTFIGRPATELPTPAFVLSKDVLDRNVQRLLDDVEAAGVGFRPHVKTLKCTEITRQMLGPHTSAVASTLREMRALLPLAREENDHGKPRLTSVLYGVPLRPGALPELQGMRRHVDVEVLLDHDAQVDALEDFVVSVVANGTTTNGTATNGTNGTHAPATAPWPAFIKIDMGTSRAGLTLSSPRLPALVARVTSSPAIRFRGFYTHAGHAYSARSASATATYLADELGALRKAAALVPSKTLHTQPGDGETAAAAEAAAETAPLTLSLGSTPTAHALSSLSSSLTQLPPGWQLELHAGNFPVNDLQQLGTRAVQRRDMAARVLAECCSVYPERDEALLNAGVVALGREAGPLGGWARVAAGSGGGVGGKGGDGVGGVEGEGDWVLGRLSQEHGILVREGEGRKVEEAFKVGQKVWLDIQHACITAAAYPCYFVVDEGDVVCEVWWPWRGW